MKQVIGKLNNDWEVSVRSVLILSRTGHVYERIRVIDMKEFKMQDLPVTPLIWGRVV